MVRTVGKMVFSTNIGEPLTVRLLYDGINEYYAECICGAVERIKLQGRGNVFREKHINVDQAIKFMFEEIEYALRSTDGCWVGTGLATLGEQFQIFGIRVQDRILLEYY